jgi:hypothetical protein
MKFSLGHRSIKTMDIYDHLSGRLLNDIINPSVLQSFERFFRIKRKKAVCLALCVVFLPLKITDGQLGGIRIILALIIAGPATWL